MTRLQLEDAIRQLVLQRDLDHASLVTALAYLADRYARDSVNDGRTNDRAG